MFRKMRTLRYLGGDRGEFVVDFVNRESIPVQRILDIGCAFGWVLGALTGKAYELVGIDMDEAALRQAETSFPHIHFVHQSASVLPFADKNFDIAILSEVIEHVGDENKQLVID